MSMNITSEERERDGWINKGRGMGEFVVGRARTHGGQKRGKIIIPVKMWVIPEQIFISVAVKSIVGSLSQQGSRELNENGI